VVVSMMWMLGSTSFAAWMMLSVDMSLFSYV